MHRSHRTHRFGRLRRTVGAAVALALTTGLVATAPLAASAAEVTTDYPEITVQPGQTTTFDLSVTSNRTERVEFSVADKPDGWEVNIRGGGHDIGAATVSPGSSPSVEVSVSVPDDAEPGDHTVVINAGGDQLSLTLDVEKTSQTALKLTTDFSKLQGTSTDTFSFEVTVTNNSGQDITLSLTAKGPTGWTTDASPQAKSQASTVDVDANGSAAVEVTADPPDSVTAGMYPIVLIAESAQQAAKIKLVAQVTGSAELTLTTPSGRLNASGTAGSATEVELVVANTGNAPLQDVKLSATPPSEWQVEFEPKTITAIAPGESTTATMSITPAGNAITGDYVVTAKAQSASSTDSVDIRYSVQTSSWWGLVGIVIIVLVVVGLLWALRHFGRR